LPNVCKFTYVANIRCLSYLNPAHSAYFAVFESTKKLLGADQAGHHPLQAGISGALAAVSHDLCITPFDVVKQRMQLGYYENVQHCIRTVLRTEGVTAFYLSFPTTLMMNIPFGAVMVAVNESVKKVLNPSEKYNIAASMASGSIAGAVAAALTNPLDVVKTRLQTQNLDHCMKSCEDPVFNPVTSEPKVAAGAKVTISNAVGQVTGVATAPLSSSPHPHQVQHRSVSTLVSQQHHNTVDLCKTRGAVLFPSSGSRPFSALMGTFKISKISIDSVYGRCSRQGGAPVVLSKAMTARVHMSPALPPAGPASPSAPPPIPEKQVLRALGMVQMARSIYVQEGLVGFLRGMVPRMLVHAPSVAISWTAYEGMKSVLAKH
jgi:hypothetical protein